MQTNAVQLILRTLCALVLVGQVECLYGSDLQEDSGYVENYAENLARDFPVSISVSQDLEVKLAKLVPTEASRMKRAIDAGNRFVQQYMDGYACGAGSPDWDTKITSYVEDPERINSLCATYGDRIARPGEQPIMKRLLCSRTTLESVRSEPGGIVLTYQMVEVGKISTEKLPVVTDLDTAQTGKTVRTAISVNATGKVYNFAPQGGILEEMYSVQDIFPKGKAVDKFDGRIYRKACGVGAKGGRAQFIQPNQMTASAKPE